MDEFYSRIQIEGATAIVRNRTHFQPTVGVVLGSGLSELANSVENADIIESSQIPHWPKSTVTGHKGKLIIGRLSGKVVMMLQGRSHFYEGLSVNQITLPVRVMASIGIKTLIVTNAAGGINPSFRGGDLMLIKDHINLPGLAGNNPLRGPNDDQVGVRFPDMTHPYDPELRKIAREVAAQADFSVQEGVYTYVAGPSFETPAELRFIKMIGGDAVGMSTVPSVIVARHAGMRVLGISSITNMAHLDPDESDATSHEEVLEAGKEIVPRLETLLRGVIKRLD
ncbi:MAG: purine-nucleoside phosphorylase [Ardenticatenaceae bacterium]|nr:purine-nucleoside phosphorylase [Ardenticatenaceae bacterium]